MKKTQLFHPRVFSDKKWAEGYYQRNKNNITKVGKRLVKHLKSIGFTGGKVLDVGCGFGAIAIEIAKAFPNANIIGVDLGEPLLEMGKKFVKEANLEKQITLQKGDAQNLQFEDNSFNLVINSFLLHIVENPTMMLKEIERVAKPESKILITDLRRGFLAFGSKKMRNGFTLNEASIVIKKSNIRNGKLSKGLFWWDYFV